VSGSVVAVAFIRLLQMVMGWDGMGWDGMGWVDCGNFQPVTQLHEYS
jgi:hypothetical protein